MMVASDTAVSSTSLSLVVSRLEPPSTKVILRVSLAAGLSEPRDTIEDVVEPYLLQLGLIARTARGRQLNPPGWKHLGLNPPAGSQDGLFDTK